MKTAWRLPPRPLLFSSLLSWAAALWHYGLHWILEWLAGYLELVSGQVVEETGRQFLRYLMPEYVLEAKAGERIYELPHRFMSFLCPVLGDVRHCQWPHTLQR